MDGICEMMVEKNMCEEGWIDEAKEGEIYSFTHDLLHEVISGILIGPKESHEAFYYAHAACELLEELKTREEDTPFSIRLDLYGPHQPYHPTMEYASLYPPEDIRLPVSFRDDLNINLPGTACQTAGSRTD